MNIRTNLGVSQTAFLPTLFLTFLGLTAYCITAAAPGAEHDELKEKTGGKSVASSSREPSLHEDSQTPPQPPHPKILKPEPPEPESSNGNNENDAIAAQEWVRRLGDNSFYVRETAAQQLEKQGAAARRALLTGLDGADLEVRLRCQEILSRIQGEDLESRLKAFISGEDDSHNPETISFPGWKVFRETVGDTQQSREFFADIIRRDAPLLEAADAGGQRLLSTFRERLESLEDQERSLTAETPPPALLGALLLVAAHPQSDLNSSLQSYLISFFNQSSAERAIQSDRQGTILKKLMSAWLRREADSRLASNLLAVALRYELEDTATAMARKIVQSSNVSPYVLPNAILAIGRYGNRDDVSLLEPLLDHTTVCHTWVNTQFEEPIKIQVRDVALAVLVHLMNQNHKDYGFEFLRKYEQTLFSVHTLGFNDDAKREAAHARWRKYRSEKKEP